MMQNPYNNDIVGKVKIPMLNYSGAKDYNKRFKQLQRNGSMSGYICCITLGTVIVERVPFSNAVAKEFNCSVLVVLRFKRLTMLIVTITL